MKVSTARFGEFEVDESEIIELPSGLIGFPELNKFILLNHDEESPFKWLQSVDDGSIAFVLINPLLFRPDYTVEVPEAEVSDLGLQSEEDAVISVIITMPSNPQNMTANLKAPLIFNLQNRKGKQIILNQSSYTTRHNIMEEMRKHNETAQNQESVRSNLEKVRDQQNQAQTASAGDSITK
ncbi:MAG: flagellar assembly protein FliW [Deltaproteobacteria bacterium]|nr:flagellar assembly protein FliW [Deltaproteobacteria bacterium]